MKTFYCEQQSPEWWELHRGVPTAGSFDRIITPKKAQLSAGADDLICELIAQRLTIGSIAPQQGFTSHAIQHGIETEAEARRWYEMDRGLDVQQVGMCMTDDGRFGCSPDGLVNDDGGLELKCPTLKTHVAYLRDGVLPAEYKPQVHGCLIVTGRLWWDFLSYAPGLDPLLVRVTPDEFTEKLRECLELFWASYITVRSKIEKEGIDVNGKPTTSQTKRPDRAGYGVDRHAEDQADSG